MTDLNYKSVANILVAVLVGLVFTTTGIAKAFAFGNFVITVNKILPSLTELGEIIALLIVAIEIVCGLLLLIRYRIIYSSSILLFLTLIFIGIILNETSTGISIDCNCFGALDFNLSNKTKIIVDIILFNSLLFISIVNAKSPRNEDKRLSRKSWKIILIVILLTELSLINFVYNFDKKSTHLNITTLLHDITPLDSTFV